MSLASRLGRLRGAIYERVLRHSIPVRHEGSIVFTMRNYSRRTAKRAQTFSTKHPEILAWIDAFAPDDVLMDIGANVGIYTLYAAYRGHRVFALEPDALNFALLNLNIRDNGFDRLASAYPYSLHREPLVAELHMGDCDWGGSQKSFGRGVDWRGNAFDAVYRQGSAGISVDEFVRQTGVCPTHVKIDVDGNETFVLEGACETLGNPATRSLVVELFSEHEEYEHCMSLIEDAGFKLISRATRAKRPRENRATTENHTFVR